VPIAIYRNCLLTYLIALTVTSFSFNYSVFVVSQTSELAAVNETHLLERQLERQRRISDVCATRLSIPANTTSHIHRRKLLKSIDGIDGMPDPREFANIRVLEERRILYCEVQDVNYNTHWKRILIYLTGKSKVESPNALDPYDVHAKLSDEYIPRLSRC